MKTMTMGELPPNLPTGLPEGDDAIVDVEPDAPTEDDKFTENEDGSVDVDMSDDDEEVRDPEFMENLADGILPEDYLNTLGLDYVELIEQDIEAREERDKQYEEGIKRTGMGNNAPGGADFEGASKAVHPMLTKGCVDFASRAVKELFPSTGPCKTQIIGDQTEAKVDRAERKKQYMNWQSTTQIEENRSELEKLLSQVPLGGAQYKRWWWDPELRRPRTEAVFIDDVFTPVGHSDFYTSPRVTHRQRILRGEYERRIRTGLYRQLNLTDDSYLALDDESRSQAATDKVEGVDPDAMHYNKDGLRLIYQVDVMLMVPGDDELDDGKSAPYVVHIDKSSKKVLGMFRNWKKADERFRKKHWTSEWPFIPWRGGPAVGLAHIIGSLSGAATGALRAIIDAAHIQNFPGGLMLSGGKTSGQSIQVNATELAKIDPPAGTTDADIRKLVMAFPFNGPSAVLFQTLEWLTQQAEQVVSTASEAIADAGSDMPVGTALALIEHGAANFSAIHARLHNAMKHDLEILHRLNSENLSDKETAEDLGELVVSRADFEGPQDIIPVSDPNIFSETQRFAQLQAVMQLKADPQFAPYFKADQLLARALKLLQVTDVDSFTNLPKESKKLDPLEENYVSSTADEPRPLKVYESQDDMTHLRMHIQYATSPMFGANPLIAPSFMPGMLQHCKEHLLALYKKHTKAAVQAAHAANKMQDSPWSDEDVIVKGAAFAEHMIAQLLSPQVMPGMQQMQQIASQVGQAAMPKPEPNVQLQEDTKVKLAQLKITNDAQQADQDRKAEAQAAMITAQIAQSEQKSQEGLAQLTSQVEILLAQQQQGATQMLEEFKAAKAGEQILLTEVLTAVFAAATPKAGPPGPDGKPTAAPAGPDPGKTMALSLLKPLLEPMEAALSDSMQGITGNGLINVVSKLAEQQQNLSQILNQSQAGNAQALAELAQAVSGIQQQTQQTASRETEIYVGPDGKKRARFVQPQQQPQQAPPQQPQPQPQGGMPPQGQQPQGPMS